MMWRIIDEYTYLGHRTITMLAEHDHGKLIRVQTFFEGKLITETMCFVPK